MRGVTGIFQLLVSDHLLAELTRTLQAPYFRGRLTSDQIARALALVARRGINTPLTARVEGIASHPEDDAILATAISGHADYLVTGDLQLQKLGTFQMVRVLSPREFMTILSGNA